MQIKIYEQDDGFLIAVDNVQDCREVIQNVLTAMAGTPPTAINNLEKIKTADITPSLDGATPIEVKETEIDLTIPIQYISSPIRRAASEALAKTYGYANLEAMLNKKNPAEIQDLYRILVIKGIISKSIS